MSTDRRAYDDAAPVHEMHADCLAAGRNLRLPVGDRRLDRAARAATGPVPSILYSDFPREVAKRDIRVDEAAQRLANALHLHLD
ncbi:hypothetical protein [Nocardioides sp. SYSU DS0663]|uniref:hypothetical protein n=1 Tax=Nocardioides sp. SYSU DS0663 TaxID=3416445 RepID=UPI003F4C71EA